MAAMRTWQEDCGVTINQLSGGSKAHWLARAFSEAFLMRSANGNAVTVVPPAELVKRSIGVLEHAVASLAGMNDGRDDSGPSRLPVHPDHPRRLRLGGLSSSTIWS
jgi:hypothetical protein